MHYNLYNKKLLPLILVLFFLISCDNDSSPKLIEQQWSIKTYPFSDPNPIPILTNDARLYPYHSFLGYSHDGVAKNWEVIKMENEHIEVYVLPQVGGKIWGAIDKKNGQEFIYRNEVMKFRNIALRGPWTSGGIEFNFGVIGHTPSTATPVDYSTRINKDGSISTFVGAMDLPSRTQWRVEIKVDPDRANFSTHAQWYNSTPSLQAYYNWMTAAAFAQADLEMVFPGDRYLKHSGEVLTWPIDNKKRNLTLYDNNRFEGHKSYHVVGEWKNFFGGYYHKDNYGFGHWSPHDKMPGQKLWLWALSEEGGIWEEHLTDTDGQYIEFQAGRQLVQYSPDNNSNPITKAAFEPFATDRWTETWFPVGEIGGITKASNDGVMNIGRQGDQIIIKLHSFIKTSGQLKISTQNGMIVKDVEAEFNPREIKSFNIEHNGEFNIHIDALDLYYSSNPKINKLDRSYSVDQTVLNALPIEEKKYIKAHEYFKERKYAQSEKVLNLLLIDYKNHLKANYLMADIHYRKGEYNKAINNIKKCLSINAYDADANFLAGNIYKELGRATDAKEAYGWASRSAKYKSSALGQIANIYLAEKKYKLAIQYAKESTDYNKYNLNAIEVIIISNRLLKNNVESKKWIDNLLWIDPLNHFARFELYLIDPATSNWGRFTEKIRNEFPEQTYLELAISYYNRKLFNESKNILSNTLADHPLGLSWLAFINSDDSILDKANALPANFVHPFRMESIKMLEWAQQKNDFWKWKYYLALNYWAKQRINDAYILMQSVKNIPKFAPFYASRAHIKTITNDNSSISDIEQSINYGKKSWPILINAIKYYQKNNNWKEAKSVSQNAIESFPNNFNLELLHVKSLLFLNELDAGINILDKIQVLPSEIGRESHELYLSLHLAKALELIKKQDFKLAKIHIEKSKVWPKNLGIGKPYVPNEQIQKILEEIILNKSTKNDLIKKLSILRKKEKGYKNKLINNIISIL